MKHKWMAIVLYVLLCGSSLAQTSPPVSQYASLVGVVAQDDDTGWTETVDSSGNFSLREYQKDGITVAFFTDDTFFMVKSDTRQAQAEAKARVATSVVLLVTEAQAYLRAREVLEGTGLWRTGYANSHCDLGPTVRATGENSSLTDGRAEVIFTESQNGFLLANGGGARVYLDRFSGDVITIAQDHPLTNLPTSATVSTIQVRANVVAYIESPASGLIAEDQSACLSEFQSAQDFPPVYVLKATPTNKWQGGLVYRYFLNGPGIGFEIDGSSGVVTIEFRTRGQSAPAGGSTPGLPNGLLAGGIAAIVGALGIALVRKKRLSKPQD